MQRFQKFEVDSYTYSNLRKVQIKNGTQIKEQYIGSRKKLFSQNYLIATTANNAQLELNGLSHQKFNSFLGLFSKNLYSQFHKNEKLFDLNIHYKGLARDKNIQLWNSVPDGTYLYNLDLSSAYWQFAFSLGYISESFFTKYMSFDEYKTMKRYCISFLARKNKMVYRNDNGTSYEIYCDNTVLQRVYDNIRNKLYLSIEEVRSVCNDNWVEYNIDGVLVLNEDLKKVKAKLKNMNLNFKITECQKINDKELLYGNRIRKFRK
jgi:hypothetical protein